MLVKAEISLTYSEQFAHGVLSLLLGLVTVLVWGLEVLGVTMGGFLTKDLGLGLARGVTLAGIFIPLVIVWTNLRFCLNLTFGKLHGT